MILQTITKGTQIHAYTYVMQRSKTLSFSVVLSVVSASLIGVNMASPATASDPFRPAQIQLVKDIKPGAGDSSVIGQGLHSLPHELVKFKDHAYFTANDGVHGLELWRTDGTTSELVHDINPGTGHGGDPSGPVIFGAADDYLYFRANDGSTGEELWATDGNTTWLVRDINPGARGSGPSGMYKDFAIVGNDIYFSATQTFPNALLNNPGPNDVVHETELWRASGSSAQRFDVLPTESFNNPDSSSPGNFASFNGSAYFVAGIDEMSPTGGTRLTSMFRANSGGFTPINNVPGYNMKQLDSRLFYIGVNRDNRFGIYSLAGGEAPTFHHSLEQWKTEDGGLSEFFEFNDYLYFRYDGALWRTNGSSTNKVSNFTNAKANPSDFAVLDDHLYFTADDGVHGRELWRTDGSQTKLVEDIRTGDTPNAFLYNKGAQDAWLTEMDGFLYFAAITNENGRELWRTNGSRTEMVADLNLTEGNIQGSTKGSGPSGLTRLGDQIVFSANDGKKGQEIWRVIVPSKGVEGPPGHANCSDGVDNDEDGLIDAADPDCAAGPNPTPSPTATPTTNPNVNPQPAVAPARKPAKVGHLKAKYNKKKRTVTLTWRAANANGARITQYRIVLKRKGTKNITLTVSGARLKLLVKRLKKGRYTVTVQAKNARGFGAASKKVNVRVR